MTQPYAIDCEPDTWRDAFPQNFDEDHARVRESERPSVFPILKNYMASLEDGSDVEELAM
jgi:hypothetical protein